MVYLHWEKQLHDLPERWKLAKEEVTLSTHKYRRVITIHVYTAQNNIKMITMQDKQVSGAIELLLFHLADDTI